ncbi:MAG: hypothetical protein ABW215_00560 [Kibdelosporangium sp.]
MTQGFSDAVARFDSDVDHALSRARRAAADAREQSARFRRDTAETVDRARSGELRLEPEEVTDEELRKSAAQFRGAQGLPVEQFGDMQAVQPAKPRQVRTSSDEDDDFSQEQIMRNV